MDSLAEVLTVMVVVVVAGCLCWGALEWRRERRAAHRFAALVESELPSGLDADLTRVRLALAELRRDVELWDRGGRP
ncbi:hypothetical protein ABH931_006086 [Streptacidiphilus sp. MAP12-33]|uniref:hypothetical protein n=1 Tax=Streptacidiphilus sp. MAP12-33 TaxID=3156266 RepID=UPI0035126FB9